MASTFDSSHPVPIIATQEGIVQQAYAHTYDEKPVLDLKTPIDEKNQSSSDVEVVVVDGDIIRESDYTPEQYKKLLRKIDRYLLPLMCMTVLIHALPR